MKLGKLLAAGKSIMSGRTNVAYRANKQIYLPKFESDKNPFKSEAPQPQAKAADNVPVPVVLDSKEAGKPAAVLPRAVDAASREIPVAIPANINASQAQRPAGPVSLDRKSGWAGKFNPISIFKAPSSKANAAAGTQKMAPTQTELSLDSVRVVHNDLSDADVEIVPIKSRSSVPEMQPAKKSWEFLGERLLGVETT